MVTFWRAQGGPGGPFSLQDTLNFVFPPHLSHGIAVVVWASSRAWLRTPPVVLRPRRGAFGCLASGLHAYDTDTTTVTKGWEGGRDGAPGAPPSSPATAGYKKEHTNAS